ncbi:MAG: hypothetical protein ACLFPE_09240, partial [Bacteroidales bacterium]
DSLEGPAVYYQKNGLVKAEGTYHRDLKSGRWKYYTEEGELQRTETYRDGVLVSRETFIDMEPEDFDEKSE